MGRLVTSVAAHGNRFAVLVVFGRLATSVAAKLASEDYCDSSDRQVCERDGWRGQP